MAGPNIINFGSKVQFLNGAVFVNGQPVSLPNSVSDPGSAVAGEIYYNSTSNTVRYYNGTTWTSLGASSSSYSVNTFILGSSDITNGYVTLSSTPDVPTDTILTVIGGPMQSYGTDFTVSSAQLTFINSLAVGGFSALVSGDILVIQYN
jgi:hypothetical protein